MKDLKLIDEAGVSEKDQRRHIRKRVLWAAQLETADGTFNCIVLNVSRSGAKLRFAKVVQTQEPVALLGDAFGKIPAEVVWQRGDKVGIRFAADPEQIAQMMASLAL